MTPDEFDAACAALPAVSLAVQWGDANVWKVAGKVFAVRGPDGGCVLKVSEIAYEALTSGGVARPAPYFARGSWVRFDDPAAIDEGELRALVVSAHSLIAGKLTRRQRAEAGLG